MTPAKDIHLNKNAFRLLKKISKGKSLNWVSIEETPEYKTLIYFGLISHTHGHKTGEITEKGFQVLLHRQHADDDRKQEHRHNWFIAIFSTLGGAILSRPLWDGIELLIEWVQKII